MNPVGSALETAKSRDATNPGLGLAGHGVASGKPVGGLIHFLLSHPLATHWLTAPGSSRSGPEGLAPFAAEDGGHGGPIARPCVCPEWRLARAYISKPKRLTHQQWALLPAAPPRPGANRARGAWSGSASAILLLQDRPLEQHAVMRTLDGPRQGAEALRQTDRHTRNRG